MKTKPLCIWLFCVLLSIPSAWCADQEIEGCILVEGGKLFDADIDPYINNDMKRELLINKFYIGKTEVTWAEWQAIRDWAVLRGYTDLAGAGKGIGGNHPVSDVSWLDVVKWCNARSEKEGREPVYMNGAEVYRTGEVPDPRVIHSANGYRLPTEAEWVFAARGGTKTNGYKYSGSNDLNAVGWWNGNTIDRRSYGAHEVGKKQPNELGIYDMSGNLSEWCERSERENRLLRFYRAARGGDWMDSERSISRSSRKPSAMERGSAWIGFRVAVSAFLADTIKLDRQWKSSVHPAGTGSAREIGMLLGQHASAFKNPQKTPSIRIYKNLTYLATMKSIEPELKQIVLKTGVAPRPLNTPGFPSYSLRIYSYDPKDPTAGFDGYDRMHVVVDKADQVVLVELTTETPSKSHSLNLKSQLYKTWDFVNNITKASSIAEIQHETSRLDNLIEIRSSFLDKLKGQYEITPLKESKLYLPVPLAELILACVESLEQKK